MFQIESRAQMQSLLRTRPMNLEDLTIQVAIVRPGPIQGGAVNPYIQRLQRLRVDPGYEIPYDHPTLEPVLRLRIEAMLSIEPAPEPIAFDTLVNSATAEVQVKAGSPDMTAPADV